MEQSVNTLEVNGINEHNIGICNQSLLYGKLSIFSAHNELSYFFNNDKMNQIL